jgi:NodT family efflux transporter outer membrane factor (OMF) lipoprotein
MQSKSFPALLYASLPSSISRNRRPWIALPAALLAAALAGCAVTPQLDKPTPPSASGYTTETIGPVGGGAVAEQKITLGKPLDTAWWTLLKSSALDQLVELAMKNNQTLEAARQNLAKAREETASARGGVGPQATLGASAARGYNVAFGQSPGTIEGVYQVGPGLSYELPLFGKQQSTVAYAEAEARRSQAELQAAQLSVSGNVVLQALEIASVSEQIRAVEIMVDSDRENLKLLQQAQAAGAISKLDVIAAQSQLDQDSTLLPPYRERLKHAQVALTILVGKTPAEWKAPDLSLETISLPPDLPVALPSELLRRRPDILAAEAQMAAAGAQVGIATANLYPRIALTANMSVQGFLSGGSTAIWNLLGGITMPLFDGGSLSAQKRAAEATYRAALAQYQHTVIAAFGQVADAMYGLSSQADAMAAQQRARDSADATYALTWQGYKNGNAGYVRVLLSKRAQQQATLALLQARKQRYEASVTLLLASGGE